MYSEYVGITQEVASEIENLRLTPVETKNDILKRVLAVSNLESDLEHSQTEFFDLGQGAKLRVGEKLFLFLNEAARRAKKPDAVADVRKEGIFLDGELVKPSHGSSIQPAMRKIQERKGHRNSKGEIKSLSAWRQWNVVRQGKFITLLELKDPKLARKRNRSADNIELDDFCL